MSVQNVSKKAQLGIIQQTPLLSVLSNQGWDIFTTQKGICIYFPSDYEAILVNFKDIFNKKVVVEYV